MSEPATLPMVCVVVIGRNEGERLMRCLASLGCLEDHAIPHEVIYVDSDSTDGSPGRAAAAGARVIGVRPARPCAAVGRNAGWRAARGELVLFLDGDTVLDPGFVPAALAALDADPKVAVVWGHRREMHPEASLYNRVLDLDWVYPPGPAEFCGGDAVMRRATLERVGGYDEGLIAGEEPELCRRIRAGGETILHIDQPMTLHDLAMTRFRQYWRRAVRAGHAYAEVSARFAGTPMPLWREDSRRNLERAGVLVGALGASVVAAAAVHPVLLLAWPGMVLALSVRTARRVAWKGGGWATLLLYGLHSHLQQIPIAIGQMGFWWDRRRGRRRGLIEYK